MSVTLLSLASAGLLGAAALVIARELGPDGRGAFAASYSLVYVLTIAGSLGIGLGGRRLLALGPSSGGVSLTEYAAASRVLVALQFPIATIGALTLLSVFGAGRNGAEQVAFIACSMATLSSLLSRDALFGVGDGVAAALILAGGCAATLVGVVGVALVGQSSVATYLAIYALAGAAETVACTFRASRGQVHNRSSTGTDARIRILSSGRAVVVQLLAHAAATRGDRLVIGAVAGPAELGLYAVAVSVMELLSMASFALGNVSFQGVASGSLSPQSVRRARRLTVLGTAGAALVLIVMAPWIIRFGFGSRFEAAVPALRVLAAAAVPYGSFQIDTQQLIASARERTAAMLGVAAATSMVIGDLIVVPRWGIEGAAWISLAVYCSFAVASRVAVDARSDQ